MAGFEAHFSTVVAPRTVGNAGDRLAARGQSQAHGQVDVIDEVPLRVILDRRSVPGQRRQEAT